MAEEGVAAAPGSAAEKVIHTYPLIRAVMDGCIEDNLPGAYDPLRDEIMKSTVYNYGKIPPMMVQSNLWHSDMSEEMRTEAMELSVTACEKFSQNNELAARMVKESMDKKFGPAFHVVVGESYGFEITYECTTICYMYFGGNQAICIWKCS